MTIVSVAQSKFLCGSSADLINNDNPQLWGFESMELRAALEQRYSDDAHFVCYYGERNGAVLPYLPRLQKGTLGDIRAAGIHIWHDCIGCDADTPGHKPITADQLSWLSARLTDKSVIWYPTKSGARLVKIGSQRFRPEEAERATLDFVLEVRGWLDDHGREGDWRVDCLCDWTRHFRLPLVRRDGVDTEAEIAWQAVPVTISYPDEPDERPRAQLPAAPTEAEIAAMQTQLVDGCLPELRPRLTAILDRVRELGTGHDRHPQLYRAARTVGGYVGARELTRDAAEAALYGAIAGWPWGSAPHFVENDYQRCCRDGLDYGEREPLSVRIASVESFAAEQCELDRALAELVTQPCRAELGPVIGEIDESDAGLANEFLRENQHRMRVAGDERSPMWWDQGTGLWVAEFAAIREAAKLFVEQKARQARDDLEALGPASPADDADLKAARKAAESRAKWFRACKTHGKLSSMTHLALDPLRTMEWDLFDANTDLLPFTNGVLELRTGLLRPYKPEDLFTKCIPYGYDRTATAPLWLKSLEQWHPDPATRDWLQRRAGAALGGSTRDQIVAVHYGKGGTGKSTYLDTKAAALGPLAVKGAKNLVERQRGGETHPANKWQLKGKRFVYVTELKPNLDTDSLNEMTGDAKLNARGMGKEFANFRMRAQLDLSTTNKPRLPSNPNDGVFGRLATIPWLNAFRGSSDRNVNIQTELLQELPGIMNWLVEGYRKWLKQGLRPFPEAIADANKTLMAGDVLEFLEENFTANPEGRIPFKLVWDARKRWNHERNAELRERKSDFGGALRTAGIEVKPVGKSNTVHVIGWASSSADEAEYDLN